MAVPPFEKRAHPVEDIRPVQLGASLPSQVSPDDSFTARFVAYNKELEEKVREILTNLSSSSITHLGVKKCYWALGTSVKVRFYGVYLRVDNPEQTFIWDGEYTITDFDVKVEANAPQGTTIAKFDVFIEDFLVANLRIDLRIQPNACPQAKTTIANASPIQTAFASYASKDKLRVLDRVDAIKISAGIDVFIDCLSLHPNERWKVKLEKEIGHRDTFILFWSKYAKKSKWVTWEWHKALDLKGKDAMQIQPLQTVSEAPPPDELIDIHFGSECMLARKAYEDLEFKGKD